MNLAEMYENGTMPTAEELEGTFRVTDYTFFMPPTRKHITKGKGYNRSLCVFKWGKFTVEPKPFYGAIVLEYRNGKSKDYIRRTESGYVGMYFDIGQLKGYFRLERVR